MDAIDFCGCCNQVIQVLLVTVQQNQRLDTCQHLPTLPTHGTSWQILACLGSWISRFEELQFFLHLLALQHQHHLGPSKQEACDTKRVKKLEKAVRPRKCQKSRIWVELGKGCERCPKLVNIASWVAECRSLSCSTRPSQTMTNNRLRDWGLANILTNAHSTNSLWLQYPTPARARSIKGLDVKCIRTLPLVSRTSCMFNRKCSYSTLLCWNNCWKRL